MKITKTQFKSLIALSLMGGAISSCNMMDMEEANNGNVGIYKSTGLSTSPNILYQETFEGDDPFSFAHTQFAEAHSFGAADNPIFAGIYSGRFELRDDDEMTANGTRAEVLFPEQSENERWYSFSLYLPSDGFKKDSNNDIINQWHQGSGSGSPTTTLRVKNDRFFLKSGPTKEERVDYDIAAVKKDAWNEFVIHIVHSGDSDGLVELWLNGEKMLSINGGNLNKDYGLPRWKIGIYKDDWNYDETTDTDLRIMYFDNVRMGDENASFEEMSSIGESTGSEESTDSAGSTDTETEDGGTTSESTETESIDDTTEEDTTTSGTESDEESVEADGNETTLAGNSGNEINGQAKGKFK